MKKKIFLLTLILIATSVLAFQSPYARRIRPFFSTPVSCQENEIGYNMTSHELVICKNTGYTVVSGGGGGGISGLTTDKLVKATSATTVGDSNFSEVSGDLLIPAANRLTLGVNSIGYEANKGFKLYENDQSGFAATFNLSGFTANWEYTFPDANGTLALSNQTLAQFAATTSAQLAGVLTNESGTGVFLNATLTSLTANDVLTWSGTNWINQAPTGGGGTTINPTDNFIPYRSNSTTFADSPLVRLDANTIEQRNSTNAQRLILYRIWTSSTNNDGLRLGRGDSSDVVVGTFQGSGGGTAQILNLHGSSIKFLTGTSSLTEQWQLNSTNFQPASDNTEALCGEGNRCTTVTLGTGIKFFDAATNTESPLMKRVSGSVELWDNDSSNFTFFKDAGRKRVSTQFDKTDTTLATITGLTSENLKASTAYSFRATLFFDANATGGHKYAISGTATATSIIYHIDSVCDSTNLNIITSRQTALGGNSGQAGCATGKTIIEGTILVNTAGTLTVQFAQNAASGTSSILVNSTLKVEKF